MLFFCSYLLFIKNSKNPDYLSRLANNKNIITTEILPDDSCIKESKSNIKDNYLKINKYLTPKNYEKEIINLLFDEDKIIEADQTEIKNKSKKNIIKSSFNEQENKGITDQESEVYDYNNLENCLESLNYGQSEDSLQNKIFLLDDDPYLSSSTIENFQTFKGNSDHNNTKFKYLNLTNLSYLSCQDLNNDLTTKSHIQNSVDLLDLNDLSDTPFNFLIDESENLMNQDLDNKNNELQAKNNLMNQDLNDPIDFDKSNKLYYKAIVDECDNLNNQILLDYPDFNESELLSMNFHDDSSKNLENQHSIKLSHFKEPLEVPENIYVNEKNNKQVPGIENVYDNRFDFINRLDFSDKHQIEKQNNIEKLQKGGLSQLENEHEFIDKNFDYDDSNIHNDYDKNVKTPLSMLLDDFLENYENCQSNETNFNQGLQKNSQSPSFEDNLNNVNCNLNIVPDDIGRNENKLNRLNKDESDDFSMDSINIEQVSYDGNRFEMNEIQKNTEKLRNLEYKKIIHPIKIPDIFDVKSNLINQNVNLNSYIKNKKTDIEDIVNRNSNYVLFHIRNDLSDKDNLKILQNQYFDFAKSRAIKKRKLYTFKKIQLKQAVKKSSIDFKSCSLNSNIKLGIIEKPKVVYFEDTKAVKNFSHLNTYCCCDPDTRIILKKILDWNTVNSQNLDLNIKDLRNNLIKECYFRHYKLHPKYNYTLYITNDTISNHCSSFKILLESCKINDFSKINYIVFHFLNNISLRSGILNIIDSQKMCYDYFFGQAPTFDKEDDLIYLKNLFVEKNSIINSFKRKVCGINKIYSVRYFIWKAIILLSKKIDGEFLKFQENVENTDLPFVLFEIKHLIRKLIFYVLTKGSKMNQKTYLFFKLLLSDTIFLKSSEDKDIILVNLYMRKISNVLFCRLFDYPNYNFQYNNFLADKSLKFSYEFSKKKNKEYIEKFSEYLRINNNIVYSL